MRWDTTIKFNDKTISASEPTYFIADIAANHDGDLARAKDLIWLAKEAGADCAKFQHFLANKIVSDIGFTGELSSVSIKVNGKEVLWKFMTNIILKESGVKIYT